MVMPTLGCPWLMALELATAGGVVMAAAITGVTATEAATITGTDMAETATMAATAGRGMRVVLQPAFIAAERPTPDRKASLTMAPATGAVVTEVEAEAGDIASSNLQALARHPQPRAPHAPLRSTNLEVPDAGRCRFALFISSGIPGIRPARHRAVDSGTRRRGIPTNILQAG